MVNVVVQQHCDRLRGRLFQLVEATGMPEDQQRAFKGLIRAISYDFQESIQAELGPAGAPDTIGR